MNVLHIDEQRGWRGGEQQASYLIQGLAERGHTVVVAGRAGSPFLESDHGVAGIARVAAPFLVELDIWTTAVLARAVKRHAIDVLHAHTSHAHTAACLARRLARRGKVVVSRRVDFAPRKGPLSRWKYAQPDTIVCVADYIADVLRAYGVPESRLAVVHSGIDPSRFDVEPLPRSALGAPEGVPLLGNVAALVGHKDHANLLAAMPLLLRELPDLRLVIVGEGELRAQLEAQIAHLGLGGAVTLLGYRDDVPRILRALDAFVLSSRMEGFGGVCSEAMACGLPVVSTAAGGMPETVIHEQTGLLAPTRDPEALAAAVVRLFREPDLARRLAANGKRQAIDRFSHHRMVEGNLAVYAEVLAR